MQSLTLIVIASCVLGFASAANQLCTCKETVTFAKNYTVSTDVTRTFQSLSTVIDQINVIIQRLQITQTETQKKTITKITEIFAKFEKLVVGVQVSSDEQLTTLIKSSETYFAQILVSLKALRKQSLTEEQESSVQLLITLVEFYEGEIESFTPCICAAKKRKQKHHDKD